MSFIVAITLNMLAKSITTTSAAKMVHNKRLTSTLMILAVRPPTMDIQVTAIMPTVYLGSMSTQDNHRFG